MPSQVDSQHLVNQQQGSPEHNMLTALLQHNQNWVPMRSFGNTGQQQQPVYMNNLVQQQQQQQQPNMMRNQLNPTSLRPPCL